MKLAQDIFVKLWINRQSINLQKPFNAYIYTICPDYIGTLSDPRVLLYAYRLFKSEYCGGDKIWRNTRLDRRYLFNALGGKE